MNYRPKGPYGVVMTPVNKNGEIDFDALGKQIDYLATSSLTGIVVCGTTSEFIQMSQDENMAIMSYASKRSKDKIEVLAGACQSNINNVTVLATKAKALGLPAVMVCPPYYTPLSQEDIAEFYITLANSVDIDIILYNLPAFTSKIELDTISRLINVKNIIGIKDSSGNMKDIISYVNLARKKRPDFAILTGTDQIILPALVGGCVGSMTALSGIIPQINTEIYSAFYEKDYDKAFELQMSTIELLNTAESIVFPSGYKIIADKMGYTTGEARQVIQVEGTPRYIDTENKIKEDLKRMGLI